MTTNATDSYVKICMNTWLVCEASVHHEKQKLFPRERLLLSCQTCASSCLSVVSLFMNNPLAGQRQVFDCFLRCRECYHECRQHPDEDIRHCGNVCAHCAELLKELFFIFPN